MKSQLRKKFLEKRKKLTLEEREEKSRIITDKIVNSSQYKNADMIFTYINMGNEVATIPLIEKAWADGKKTAVPIAKKDRLMYFVEITTFDGLKKTKLGVSEPDITIKNQVFPTDKSLFIVPGSMFDIHMNRCGYGGGYYDTYIAEKNVVNTVGICYDFQLIDEIPTEQFDEKLSRIVTEKRDLMKGAD